MILTKQVKSNAVGACKGHKYDDVGPMANSDTLECGPMANADTLKCGPYGYFWHFGALTKEDLS